MYTKPRTPEQFLHNSLILVNAMHAVSLAIHIEVNDFILAVLIYFFFFSFMIVILYIRLS